MVQTIRKPNVLRVTLVDIAQEIKRSNSGSSVPSLRDYGS